MHSVTIMYDNRPFIEDWEAGWGFSCLIETGGKKLLFDTGDDGEKLLINFKRAGIDPEEVDVLTFSHFHWDHKDGAEEFLKHSSAYVYIPYFFSKEFITMVAYSDNKYELTGKTKKEIINDVYITPSMIRPMGTREQAIVLVSGKDLALITGCAHPGILNMVRKVNGFFPGKVKMVLGGFHLKDYSDKAAENIVNQLKKEGVEKFAPCHCTGEKQIEIFSKLCGEGFIETGSGKNIKFQEVKK